MLTQRRFHPPPATSMELGLEASVVNTRTITPALQVMAGVLDPAVRAPAHRRSLTMDPQRRHPLLLTELFPEARVREPLRARGIPRGGSLQVNALLRMFREESPFLPPVGQYLVPRGPRKVPQIRIRGRGKVSTRRRIHLSRCVATVKQRTPHFGGGIQRGNRCAMRAACSTWVSIDVRVICKKS
jgi:hypothetical protein